MVCKKCKADKGEEFFHRDNRAKSGRKRICKECLRIKNRVISTREDINIKQGLIKAIRNNCSNKWLKLLGIGIEELREQLRKQFSEGLSFENYGKVWGLSFFIPRRCYDINNNLSELNKLYSLNNFKVKLLTECKKPYKFVNLKEITDNNLWDILPQGNIKQFMKEHLIQELSPKIIKNNELINYFNKTQKLVETSEPYGKIYSKYKVVCSECHKTYLLKASNEIELKQELENEWFENTNQTEIYCMSCFLTALKKEKAQNDV